MIACINKAHTMANLSSAKELQYHIRYELLLKQLAHMFNIKTSGQPINIHSVNETITNLELSKKVISLKR